MHKNAIKIQAFTLIELSIVLVIIGLLVGGVVAGVELINSARLRSVYSQKEEIEAATLNFRNKYNGLPGDLENGTAFGFSANGNGNKKVGAFPGIQYGEVWQFFKQLSEAGLMSGTYTGASGGSGSRHAIPGTNVLASKIANAGFTVVNMNNYTDSNDYTPKIQTKMGDNIAFFGTSHLNGYETYAPAITATEALYIDSKFDDGLPAAGRMVAPRLFNCPDSANSTTALYNTSSTAVICSFFVMMSF